MSIFVKLLPPILCLGFVLSCAQADVEEASYIQTSEHSKTAKAISKRLSVIHYNNTPLNDEISSRFLDDYINNLDPNKLYFLESDIAEFETYRTQLDDEIKSGNLSTGINIYSQYAERAENRLEKIIEQLEADFIAELNFEKKESMLIDREDENWP